MRTLYFCSVVYSIFFIFPRLTSGVADWMPVIPAHMSWCGLSANLGSRSETCCTRLAEIQEAKIAICAPSHNVSGYIFATKAHIDNRKKKLLSSNISSRYSDNMGNFGPLAAEIGPVVWGTPANFNRFRVLAALVHGTPVVGVSQSLRS